MKIITLFIIIFLLGCSKSKERILHIKAIDPVSNDVLPGLEWKVKATKTKFFGDGEKGVFEETGVLDGNGEAEAAVILKDGWTYNIIVTEPEETCYNPSPVLHITDPQSLDQNFLFQFASCATYNLSVNNVNCQNSDDQIDISIQPENFSYEFLPPITLYGCVSKTYNTSKIPYGKWIVEWNVTRNGNTTHYDSTFYLAKNGHINFNINY